MKKNVTQDVRFFDSKGMFAAGFLTVFFLLTRILWLDRFPVFADESIYIRWAQLIIDDPQQYLFFALNDGKTPLYVWMVTLFQGVISNQLVAGRLVSVLGGLVQMYVIGLILRQLGTRRWTQVLGMAMVVLLPFWVTYHRLALMDGWLTVWLSLTFYFGLKVNAGVEKDKDKNFLRALLKNWWLIAGYGISLGLALWTKLPALFYVPICGWLPLFAWLTEKSEQKKATSISWVHGLLTYAVPHIVAVGFGGLIFLSLLVSPAFSQLFSRGQDFTFTPTEIVSGNWKNSFTNSWVFSGYFLMYLTWPVVLASVAGLFSSASRKKLILLLSCGVLFLLPFVILGKVVHPRYLLPAATFFTLAAAVSAEAILKKIASFQNMAVKLGWSVVAALLFANTVSMSFFFTTSLMLYPDITPFVQHDRVQYLEEWSSGHGIAETVSLIEELRKDHSVAVATEGRFGTLPDGLLLYFHGQNVEGLYIEGIGQYPVKSLPPFFTERAKSFDQSLLVVNSHRMQLDLPKEAKVAEFCRPNNAPCLQVWDITRQVKDSRTAEF